MLGTSPRARARTLGVFSPKPIPANEQEIAKHEEAVAYNVHLRRRIVRPPDGYFRRPQSVPLGQEQHLGIEAETFYPLLPKNDLSRLAKESFEPALRVIDRQPGEKANEAIEQYAGQFAQPRLVNGDQ